MDSAVIAIAKAIAELDCDNSIKKCLQTLFNEELNSITPTSVASTVYVRNIELLAENWTPPQSENK